MKDLALTHLLLLEKRIAEQKDYLLNLNSADIQLCRYTELYLSAEKVLTKLEKQHKELCKQIDGCRKFGIF